MADFPVTVRPLHRGDDFAAVLDLAERAFGPSGESDSELRLAAAWPTVDGGRFFGALRDGSLVGSALFLDMTQWWHGRPVPMAGVAGVTVAPETRGTGTGRALMAALLAEMEARGYPLSALYPSTTPLYRSCGYEIAGGRYEVTVPSRSLRRLLPPESGPDGEGGPDGKGTLRRAGPADAAQVMDVLGRCYAAARASGPVRHDLVTTALQLGEPGWYCYLGDDAYVCYAWSGDDRDIAVDVAVAATPAAARAVWSLLAAHGSIADTVRAVAGPADPVSWLTAEPDVRLRRREVWMLRVISAPAAVAARGFPAAVLASVPLTLADPQFPANAGPWRLEVSGGRGALTRGRPGHGTALRLGPRGFSALYAGTPLATLRQAGLAAGGDPATDDVLGAVFTGPSWMLDHF